MKYLLLLLLALPVMAQAQLEAGANYGLCFYRLTNHASTNQTNYNYTTQGAAEFTENGGNCSSVNLSYRFHKKLLAGIGYDSYVLPITSFYMQGDHYFAQPMRNIYAYIGAEYHSGRVSVTPQLLVGESIVTASEYVYPDITTGGSGLLVAFRVSANYEVWHGICINATGTAGESRLTLDDQNSVQYSDANRAINVALFSIAAGVHYRLDLRKRRFQPKS